MPEHIYNKNDLIHRFDNILGKTFGEIDNSGMFNHVQDFALQKGVAGATIEQCVLGYPPDSKQEADLVVVNGTEKTNTELKTTGMVISDHRFVAKEPMSITAVGVFDLLDQNFYSSHFWEKIEHMLIVYYHYLSDKPVTPYEYKDFPVKGYEFHEFTDIEIETLKSDWEHVYELVRRVISHHPGEHNAEWKSAVKEEYIETHGELRRLLSYIDLAPKFPPRFRLKKPVVSSMISNHFGYQLEQLPGRYSSITDIDSKCDELTQMYKGKTIKELAELFGVSVFSDKGTVKKGIAEQIVISMFGGKSKKINQIELFERFGLVGKSIALTSKGGRTEDMKLFHLDFNEITRTEISDENGNVRPIEFEDSDLYAYFADHEFLCIVFREANPLLVEAEGTDFVIDSNEYSLIYNQFLGFKRLVFCDEFIDVTVRRLWTDIRDKIFNNKVVDVVALNKMGEPVINPNGEIKSAPNFMKASENTVFIRGSGTDSSFKTEIINGVRMYPQYVWIKGSAVVDELSVKEFM